LKRGQSEAGTDGGKKDISNKREIVAESEDKDRFVKFQGFVSQIKENHENHGEKIVTHIEKGHQIGQPRNDPPLHPDGRMNAKNG